MILADQCLQSNKRFHAGNFERFISTEGAFRRPLTYDDWQFIRKVFAVTVPKRNRFDTDS